MIRPLLLSAAIVLAIQALVVLSGFIPAVAGQFADADAYMRLLRVRALWQSGDWFDARIPDANAPFGILVNWSRPLDALLLLLAAPLEPLLGFERALFWAGMLVSPLLLLATLPVWRWAVAELMTPRQFVAMTAAMLLCPQLVLIYAAARPDHHSLMALLFVAQLGLVLRLADGRHGLAGAMTAGAVQGLALWVSVEALMVGLASGAALAVVWLRWGGATLRHLTGYAAGMTVTLAAALVVERGADWAAVYYDRVSVVHLWVAAATTLGLSAALLVARRRWLALVVAGLVTAVLVYAVYPGFFRGPFAAYPPDALTWAPQTGEMQGLWPGDPATAGHMLLQLGPVLAALPWALREAWRGPRGVVPLLGMVLFLALSLHQMRWASYAQILALPAWIATAAWLWRGRPPWRGVALSGFIVVPLLAAAGLAVVAHPPTLTEAEAPACDWPRLWDWLAERRRTTGEGVVFSYVYGGPQLAWHTGYRVVGAPYFDIEALGRPGRDGIADAGRVFLGDADRAWQVLAARGVDLVVVCPSESEPRVLYGADWTSFHARLAAGVAPDWLERPALPAGLEGFRLYRRRAGPMPH